MDFSIRELREMADRRAIEELGELYARIDGAFEITSHLTPYMEGGRIAYRVQEVPPYSKRYPAAKIDTASFVDDPDKALYLAFSDEEPAGGIRVLKWWNGYGYIDDLVVGRKYRRQGLGRMLIERAAAWAKSRGQPGLMLETQNNNAAACRLYESCGFTLGGFDNYLYRGLDPGTKEVALYWYLLFEPRS